MAVTLAGSDGASRRIGPADIASAIVVVAIWTLFLVLSRQGVKGSFTPWDLAFVRFGFAAAVVLPVFLWRPAGQRFGKLTLGRALVVALFAGVGLTCLIFTGLSFAPAAHAAVLTTGTLPFSVAILGWWMFGDRIAGRKLLSLGLILVGVLCMAWYAFVSAAAGAPEGAWRGDILFPFASASWAVFVMLVRRWGIGAVDATLATALISFVLYAPVYLLFLPKQMMAAPWLDIVWNGVFQGIFALVVSMSLYTRVVQAFGPSRTTMITAVCPSLAALIAVPVLGEPLSALVLMGLAAVTAGMVVGVSSRPQATATAATAATGATAAAATTAAPAPSVPAQRLV